jgi:hypothetical protein
MRAGCADIVITPPLGTPLAGFSARHTGMRGVHDDLYARVLVLEDGDRRAALVVLDLCELDRAFVEHVRGAIWQATAISSDAVIVAATHTHAAPATFPLYSAPPDAAWLAALPGRIAGAVSAACRSVAPATLSVGTSVEAFIGRNRRRPDGPVDPTVTVLAAPVRPPDRAGASSRVLVHYACHPTVLGPDNLLASRDFAGAAVDAVMQATGGWAVFVNGACGDINAGHSADRSALGLPIPGRTFERAEVLGRQLATSVLKAVTAAVPIGGPMHMRRRSVSVPLRETPTVDEARAHAAARRTRLESLLTGGGDDEAVTAARVDLLYAELGLNWVEHRGAASAEEVEVQALVIGDAALLTLPGEFFAESGLRLRARSPYPHTIVVGYANGGVGYVPPASAFAEGGYETQLASWSRLAPEAEALILDAALGLLHHTDG